MTEVFRENVKNSKLKQGLLPAVGEMLCLVAAQVGVDRILFICFTHIFSLFGSFVYV